MAPESSSRQSEPSAVSPSSGRGATMADVARRAGVSTATVSRVLRGNAKVEPETSRRVEQAAAELSYTITQSAAALASGRTNRVALLNGGRLSHWFVSEILQGAYTSLLAGGMDLLLYRTGSQAERDDFFSRFPVRRNADAMLVSSFALSDDELEVLDRAEIPVVYLNMPFVDRPNVSIDDFAAGAKVARHLIGLGHRRLVFVGREALHGGFAWSADERARGFVDGINQSKLAIDFDGIVVDPNENGARTAVAQMLNMSPVPTGIFALHDELAIAIIKVLEEHGLRVPEDISVVGFDDYPLADTFHLTTVRQPVAEIGSRGAELAVQLATGNAPAETTIKMPTTLQMRGTTASPINSLLLG